MGKRKFEQGERALQKNIEANMEKLRADKQFREKVDGELMRYPARDKRKRRLYETVIAPMLARKEVEDEKKRITELGSGSEKDRHKEDSSSEEVGDVQDVRIPKGE